MNERNGRAMFRFHIWGDRACFARPEFRRDQITYDVITPLAARGVIEAIYWSPAIRWQVDRIVVLNPVALDWAKSDGVGRRLDLVDVAYVIEAHFSLSDRARDTDHVAQHQSLVTRRVGRQQPFQQPYFGREEYPAAFRLLKADEENPASSWSGKTVDLGWMIHDLDRRRPPQLQFYRPTLVHGIIDVAKFATNNLAV